MAISAVFSAGFTTQILDVRETLESLKFRIAAFIISAVIILHAPLLVFSGRLARCRFKGLLVFGTLVWCYDTAFDEKWLNSPLGSNQENLLGSSDIQSMADFATCYDHINEMQLVPFDTKAIAVLVLAALLPMIPLVGTAVSLKEIFMTLGEFLI